MKITSNDITDCKQNRDKFNKFYNDAIIDVLALKNCNMTIDEIKNNTPYETNFIVHVIENYDIKTPPKINTNDEIIYDVSVKINKHNINIEQMKEMGYCDAVIQDDWIQLKKEHHIIYQNKII